MTFKKTIITNELINNKKNKLHSKKVEALSFLIMSGAFFKKLSNAVKISNQFFVLNLPNNYKSSRNAHRVTWQIFNCSFQTKKPQVTGPKSYSVIKQYVSTGVSKIGCRDYKKIKIAAESRKSNVAKARKQLAISGFLHRKSE